MSEPTTNFDTGPYRIDVQVDEPYSPHVDIAAIVEAVATTLRQQNIEETTVAVLITDDESIRSLNRDYRGVDAPTDVLSFPQHDDGEAGVAFSELPNELAEELRRCLGDLVIAFPYTERQAGRYRSTVTSELRLLVVHGTLHLLGHDHATDEEKMAMWAAQNDVLLALGERPCQDRDDD